MVDTRIEYVNGRAPAGFIRADNAKVADAARPEGPIHLVWVEEDGSRYAVDIPIKPGYIIRPEGILVLQTRPDRSVSAHPVTQKECWENSFYEIGDIYPSVKQPPN